MKFAARRHRLAVLWVAALVHRVSGIGLAVFLPLHFLVLGLALRDARALDGFLRLTDIPAFKFAEAGLIFLLVVHFLGGLRLLVLEALPWFGPQGRLAIGAAAVSGIAGFVFLFWIF
jgi:succinate dehydrogenase subunit D